MINSVLVLGGGTAGLLAAIALKRHNPTLQIHLIRSKALGVIGVGEGTTVYFPKFFYGYLGIGQKRFFNEVQPVWKLGLRFKWGSRGEFCYAFDAAHSTRTINLPKCNAFYMDADPRACTKVTAMMELDRVYERDANGNPIPYTAWGYHLENHRLVSFLERAAAASMGITLRDELVEHVDQDDNGIASLLLASGERLTADLYVDCSGFRSLLLSQTLKEPFISFKSSLQNNRAVSGGWLRTDEIIQPYTACDTMNCGWCWQIDHEDCINCGYVYSSDFISDDQAEAEFRRYKPKVKDTFRVKFVSGRYQRSWVKNVVAIGNSCGFVEPLEATAISVIAQSATALSNTLAQSDRQPNDVLVDLYNRHHAEIWDDIRDFLSIHYRFNTLRDTDYWRYCNQHTDLAGAAPIVDYYRNCGPSDLHANSGLLVRPLNQFGLDGYWTLLVGQKVPFHKTHAPSETEWKLWDATRQRNRAAAKISFTAAEMLAYMRSPKWRWRN